MKIRIKRISPLQAGKMLAIIYALFCVVIVPIMLLAAVFAPKGSGGFPMIMIVVMSVIYIVGGFIGGVIGAFVYNLVAGWIGGMEMDFEEQRSQP